MRHGFSVDVEDWYHVENLSSVISRSTWDSCESRVERNIEQLLELFEQKQTKVTCFVLGDIARRHPQVVKRIATAGHEIANHGEDHRLVYDLSPEEFRASVSDLRKLLKDLSGSPVTGYRAPCFTIVKRSWWALDILAETGHTYDASVFPFARTRYGVAKAALTPHRIQLENGREIFELPPSVLQLAGKAIPIAGGGYFRLYPYAFTRWAIRRLQASGRTYFFYMHPWEIDPDQPRVSGIGAKASFQHLLNLRRMKHRVERLLTDFTFTTYSNLLAEIPAT
jgi:polysaccharide deacetylase family protein (PEP-CTERM system associated)